MVIQTYNIQLRMSDTSFHFWNTLLTQAMDAYNTCCNFLVDNNIPLGLHEVHEAVYCMLREQYQLLPAQSVIKIYKDAMASIRSQRSNYKKELKKNPNAKWQTPQKHNKSMHLDKRLYNNLTPDGICITGEVRSKRTKYEFIQYEQFQYMFEHYRVKDPLLFIRDNNIYLSVPFEVPDKPVLGNTCVGVDLGVKRLFVTSEGKAFRDKTYLRERRRVRYLKRCLKSKGTKSAKRHLKKCKHREYNLSNDMCQRACNVLIGSTNADVLVLEDLTKIKQRTSQTSNGFNRTKHNNMLSQVPFYKLKEMLTYKAPLAGKCVVTVSPKYTSQMDCRTDKRDGKRIGCRYYCSDNIVFDADWNASVNIAQRSKRPLSNTVIPRDGGIIFLSGRHLSVCQSSDCRKAVGQANVL